MTVVGKILVFLNLVFSLVVGAFAVMDYAARTHWVDYANKLKDQNVVLRAQFEVHQKDAQLLAKERENLYAQLNAERIKFAPATKGDPDAGFKIGEVVLAELRNRTKMADDLRITNDKLRKDVADEKARVAAFRSAEMAAKSEREARQADAAVLRTQLKDEQGKNFELVKEKNLIRDDMVQVQIQARTLKERNTQLEDALRKTQTDLAQARVLGAQTGGGASVNPPPDNVEGLVKRSESGLVTITLGSDAGLMRGQTMEVFRLGQTPKYIGRIRIVEVTPTQSVGQPTGRLSAPIQIGDRVASRIVGGN